jgi:hypothetical protein
LPLPHLKLVIVVMIMLTFPSGFNSFRGKMPHTLEGLGHCGAPKEALLFDPAPVRVSRDEQ